MEGERPVFGSDACIYEPYVLLRSYMALQGREEIALPEETEALIGAVYGEDGNQPGSGVLAEALAEAIASVEGIGPITAQNILTWFAHDHNHAMVEKLRRAGVKLAAESKPIAEDEQPLADLKFVITGTLSLPRDDIKVWIESLGGKVTGSVSQKTSYLVIGTDPGGSKYNRAQALDTPLLTEEDLYALAGTQKPL